MVKKCEVHHQGTLHPYKFAAVPAALSLIRVLKPLLWTCLLMVGLQCCLPTALHAAGLHPADELSLRAEGPAAPEEEVGPDGAIDLLHPFFAAMRQPSSAATWGEGSVDERCALRSAVFTVGGVQPSAP